MGILCSASVTGSSARGWAGLLGAQVACQGVTGQAGGGGEQDIAVRARCGTPTVYMPCKVREGALWARYVRQRCRRCSATAQRPAGCPGSKREQAEGLHVTRGAASRYGPAARRGPNKARRGNQQGSAAGHASQPVPGRVGRAMTARGTCPVTTAHGGDGRGVRGSKPVPPNRFRRRVWARGGRGHGAGCTFRRL